MSGKLHGIAAWADQGQSQAASSTQLVHFQENLVPGQFGAHPHQVVQAAAWVVSDAFHDQVAWRRALCHGAPPWNGLRTTEGIPP
jgi:hypothetical protein